MPADRLPWSPPSTRCRVAAAAISTRWRKWRVSERGAAVSYNDCTSRCETSARRRRSTMQVGRVSLFVLKYLDPCFRRIPRQRRAQDLAQPGRGIELRPRCWRRGRLDGRSALPLSLIHGAPARNSTPAVCALPEGRRGAGTRTHLPATSGMLRNGIPAPSNLAQAPQPVR